jgi:hypothetical protein
MEQPESLAKAIRNLTVAVWCVCILVTTWLALTLWTLLAPSAFVRGPIPDTGRVSEYQSTAKSSIRDDSDFHGLPPEEKIRRSSVVLIVEHREEKERIKAIVKEILKKTPNTHLYYNIGDEYTELSHIRSGDEIYGDGQVVFLVGNPAEMRSSYSFTGGRIGGLGQMPLAKLRELVASSQ